MDVTANGAESGNHFTVGSLKQTGGKKKKKYVDLFGNVVYTQGFGAFLGIRTPPEWIFNRKVSFLFAIITNKWKKFFFFLF